MHAVKHYKETNHTFTIELNCQRIWNYRGDNYVHRLIKTRIGENKVLQQSDDASLINQFLHDSIPEPVNASPAGKQIEEHKANTSAKSEKNQGHTLVMNLPDQIMERQIFSGSEDSRPANSDLQNKGKKYVDDRFLLEKIQNTVSEYNYLLSSQLEEQRNHFE